MQLGEQLMVLDGQFDINKTTPMEPVSFAIPKPKGGLWMSSILPSNNEDKRYHTEWTNYVQEDGSGLKQSNDAVKLKLSDSVNLLHINSEEDLKKIPSMDMMSGMPGSPKMYNFKELQEQGYDGIHYTSLSKFKGDSQAYSGIDVESTVLFNPQPHFFENIENVSKENHPYSPLEIAQKDSKTVSEIQPKGKFANKLREAEKELPDIQEMTLYQAYSNSDDHNQIGYNGQTEASGYNYHKEKYMAENINGRRVGSPSPTSGKDVQNLSFTLNNAEKYNINIDEVNKNFNDNYITKKITDSTGSRTVGVSIEDSISSFQTDLLKDREKNKDILDALSNGDISLHSGSIQEKKIKFDNNKIIDLGKKIQDQSEEVRNFFYDEVKKDRNAFLGDIMIGKDRTIKSRTIKTYESISSKIDKATYDELLDKANNDELLDKDLKSLVNEINQGTNKLSKEETTVLLREGLKNNTVMTSISSSKPNGILKNTNMDREGFFSRAKKHGLSGIHDGYGSYTFFSMDNVTSKTEGIEQIYHEGLKDRIFIIPPSEHTINISNANKKVNSESINMSSPKNKITDSYAKKLSKKVSSCKIGGSLGTIATIGAIGLIGIGGYNLLNNDKKG